MIITINQNYNTDTALRALLCRLPEAFANGEGELIYDERNTLRRFVMPSGLVVIVKAYKRPNLFQKICYSTFWKNKAYKSYIYALRLRQMGIDTPAAIAAVCCKKHGMVERYFFASTEDNRPDCRILRDGNMDNPQPLIDALMSYLIRLHDLGFMHGDTNLSNFLYDQQSDGSYHFSVIDTNRSAFLGRPATRAEATANLMRLTHKRDLLTPLVASYARQRGWDEAETVHEVLTLINKFEQRGELKHKIFHPFGT